MFDLKRYVASAVDLITRVVQKRSTTEDIVLMVIVGVGSGLLSVAIITAKFWLPIAFSVGLILWSLVPTKQPMTQTVVPLEAIYSELYRIMQKIYERAGLIRPLDRQDIEPSQLTEVRPNGIDVLKVQIAKKSQVDFGEQKLRLIGDFIQAEINSSRVVFNLFVDRVYEDYAYVFLDLIFANTDYKHQYIVNSQFAETSPPPDPTDEDF